RVDPSGGGAARRATRLHGPRDGAVGVRRPAALPERGRRARDRRGAAGAARPPARGRASARTPARGAPVRAAHDRPRPAALRRSRARRARPHRPAPPAARAPVRAGAARRARARAGRTRPRPAESPALAATIRLMSHIDELDEFEAELELALKREFAAVFPLFRYCVLTQDATYLCNGLDLKPLPQANYPYF